MAMTRRRVSGAEAKNHLPSLRESGERVRLCAGVLEMVFAET